MMLQKTLTFTGIVSLLLAAITSGQDRPNILFLFSDDHALKSISAYGGPLKETAPTPHIDRIAAEGAIFENSFCANSICGPSRASILTGKHSHKNGFLRNSRRPFDQTQFTFPKALQSAGYTTSVIGKWHLNSKPVGFDYWEILPGQGSYYNPDFIQMDGKQKRFQGYATDITTDKALAWLDKRDKTKPFLLMCQHKAPHRTFSPALRHLKAFDGIEIPEPDTLFDAYKYRSKLLATNEMEIDRHFDWAYDAKVRKDETGTVKLPGPNRYGTPEYNRMTPEQRTIWNAHFGPKNQKLIADFKDGKMDHKKIVQWKYQRYLKNYLGTVKAVDESVGRMLKYLDDNGLTKNTIVIYSSDQGFFLGEHGWYDKRWMFEESFKMPFLIRWPGVVKPGYRPLSLIQNIDYAPTFLEAAGLSIPSEVQGQSLVPILKGNTEGWRESVYYAYYELGEHRVPQQFGVRTDRQKLMYFPETDEWSLFDLERDPSEMRNVFQNPEYATQRKQLTKEYHRLREKFQAPSYEEYAPKK